MAGGGSGWFGFGWLWQQLVWLGAPTKHRA